ncbi:MAG: FMN-binding protein [Lachnospiraceae bacterium]|nr:FMN-binding protein [Lachnospiraceae bacterium]
MKNMLKEAGILFAITLLSGVLLGFIHELTKDPIAKQQELAVQNACAAVFSAGEGYEGAASFREFTPSFDTAFTKELEAQGVRIGRCYEALSAGGEVMGYVIESTSSLGYGGDIVLFSGVTAEGVLRDISILEISETAGLGMRAEEVLVPQLHNLHVPEIVYTKTGKTAENEIDAISGATITTKAVTGAVNASLRAAALLREGGAM